MRLPRTYFRGASGKQFLLVSAASLVAISNSAVGQDSDIGQELILLPATSATEPDPVTIKPHAQIAVECGRYSPSASTYECPFASNSFGLDITQRLDLPDVKVEIRAAFGRGRNAGLSLDRQMFASSPATTQENSVARLGSSARLLDGRVSLESNMAWSRSWEQPLFPAELDKRSLNEASGFSHDHRIAVTAIDRPGLKLQLDGGLTRTGRNFRAGSIPRIGTFALGYGDTERVAAKLDSGAWEAQASYNASRDFLSERKILDLELSFKGLTLGFDERLGRRTSIGSVGRDAAWATSRKASLEFDFFEIAPSLAMNTSGPSFLVPKQLRIEWREDRSPGLGELGFGAFSGEGQGFFAMWLTPIGTTLVDYSRGERHYARAGRETSDSHLLVSHNVTLDGWRVGLNLTSFRSRDSTADKDSLLNYNASASRIFASGASLSMEFGRDMLQFGGGGAEISLQDSSERARIELDLSRPLQKRLSNDSVHLTIEGQVRFDRSNYSLRFFDEVLDITQENFAREGVLISFGYHF